MYGNDCHRNVVLIFSLLVLDDNLLKFIVELGIVVLFFDY